MNWSPQRLDINVIEKCGIILTENETKGIQHRKKSLVTYLEKPGDLFLKTTRIQIAYQRSVCASA